MLQPGLHRRAGVGRRHGVDDEGRGREGRTDSPTADGYVDGGVHPASTSRVRKVPAVTDPDSVAVWTDALNKLASR